MVILDVPVGQWNPKWPKWPFWHFSANLGPKGPNWPEREREREPRFQI